MPGNYCGPRRIRTRASCFVNREISPPLSRAIRCRLESLLGAGSNTFVRRHKAGEGATIIGVDRHLP
jgi:hypothetical protein